MSIDISVFTGAGFFGDACRTYLVGDVNDAGRTLVERARQITLDTVRSCGPGASLTPLALIALRAAVANLCPKITAV